MSQAALNLTSDEKRLYGQLFQQADTDGLGVVTGDVAVGFFERTKLDQQVLGKIWQIGDSENRGLLTPAGFSIVLRLIGHAQAGREPTEALATQPGPLPRFDGISLAAAAPNPTPTASLAAQGPGGPIRVPPLTPDKVQEYSQLFQKAGAQNGMLGGDVAKSVFERARLPNEVLGQIWGLSDTKARGALDVTDFVIAMHLITSTRSGAMRALPTTLPPGLYEAASRRGPASISAVPRQLTGQQRAQSPRTFASPPLSTQTTGANWLVTPQDKAKFDQIFASIDTTGTGIVTGDQAVTFFSNSGLPEDALAQIWDLADINSEGQLTRDEFAVAMYLIRQQRGRRPGDGRGDLPTVLPPMLIPPSMRQQVAPPSQPTAPAFDNAAHATQQPKSAADDLFGLDALTGDTSPRPADATQGVDPFGNQPASPTSPKPPAAARGVPPAGFKPFIPQSSFGQGIVAQNTGGSIGSTGSQPRAQPQAQPNAALFPPVPAPGPAAAGNDDLLGDNDPEVSSKLTGETSELANMSSQISTLRNQMQDVQSKKSVNERDLNTSSAQKKDLETRLTQFRTQYEQEIRNVKALEEQLNNSRKETQQLQQQLAMTEGAHADLQTQRQQLAAALEADQKENATLKERMQQYNVEINELKPQIEKLKADSRQQKGMVAINKKQVATTEMQRDALKNEKTELEKAPAHETDSESEDEAAPHVPAERAPGSSATSPPVTSPGGTNPFFRRSPQASFDSSMAPAAFGVAAGAAAGVGVAAAANNHSAFDSFFGSSEHSNKATSPPPTSFSGPGAGSSTDTPRAGTPLTSPSTAPHTPNAGLDPPAPPQSRQITSSNLPLRQEALRTESYSSSTKANPPASRSGVSDIASPSVAGGSSVGHSEEHEAPKHGEIEPNDMPGAFPDETTPTEKSDNKSDFDDAFASFDKPEEKDKGKGKAAAIGAGAAAITGGSVAAAATAHSHSTEFPPIQDIEDDEDDSTDSEGGFDDDFEPTVPAPTTGMTGPADNLQSSSQPSAADTKELPPPPVSSQTSPPPYADAPSADQHRDSNQFPQQYTGLLPSREMSNSPPEQSEQVTPVTIASVQQPSVAHAEAVVNGTAPQTVTGNSNSLPPATTTAETAPKDDFDDAFDDLDEATEDVNPEFAASNHEDAEFNPTFASPIQSHAGAVDENATPSKTTAAASSFANFEPSFGGAQNFATANSQQPTNTSHDWDAIFSGLDKPPSLDNGKSPFDVDATTTTASPVAGSAPATSIAGPAGSAKQTSRPSPGRAISHGTEHDDPILKSLTGMGYPRDEALKALERFDYNLDKAADYLTSRR